MGGPGSERDVSLATGRGVSKALRSLGIDVVEVDVRDENFQIPIDVDERPIHAYYDANPDLFGDRGVSFEAARADIAETLREAAVDRAVTEWLEQQFARDVVLAPGFEHPADPSHPDVTHRH